MEIESSCRGDGFNAPPPIPPSEIESWARQTWTELHPWEFEQILMLDRLRRSVYFEHRRKTEAAKQPPKP